MAQEVLVSGSFDTTVRIWTPNQNELVVNTPQFVTPSIPLNASAEQPSVAPNDWTTRR
jgi:WD40 repeat protein